MKEIMVHAVHPPIPTQTFDYCAYFDGDETWQQGTGPSEKDAIIDLMEKEIDRLEDENFTLSAGVCEYRGGNEHGNPYCLMVHEDISRTYPKHLSDKAEYIEDCQCRICKMHREHKPLLDRNS